VKDAGIPPDFPKIYPSVYGCPGLGRDLIDDGADERLDLLPRHVVVAVDLRDCAIDRTSADGLLDLGKRFYLRLYDGRTCYRRRRQRLVREEVVPTQAAAVEVTAFAFLVEAFAFFVGHTDLYIKSCH